MSLQRARSIDELYDAVSEYDVVVTTDAPLSLALNRRIDAPRLGRFAGTPRMLATDQYRPRDDRRLFFRLINQTDLGWKHASYLLEHILGCWAETGDIDSITEYDQFNTPATKKALTVIKNSKSAHQSLATASLERTKQVAVIGESYFSPLDRKILPDTYERIDPFAPETTTLPVFSIFESKTAIIETLTDNISPATANDVAVVMNRSSQFPPLVESAFEINDIPFHGGPGFIDDQGIRTFLQLLRAAVAGIDPRVSDLRPILSYLDVTVPLKHDHKSLTALDIPELRSFQSFFQSIPSTTFDNALTEFEQWSHKNHPVLRSELGNLNVLTDLVTEQALNNLSFYFYSFEIPTDRDNTGVLLADPLAAAYVDRSTVFFLGMDAEWTADTPDFPWINSEKRDQQQLAQFQILLQNGIEQYYLVQNTSHGESVTPCLYFQEIFDEDFQTFDDLSSTMYSRFSSDATTGFSREPYDVETTTIETLSQTSLNIFANCPRDYFFDQLVEQPEQDYFTKGNLFHDFAEFYTNHPSFVSTLDHDDIIEIMLETMQPFIPDHKRPLLRTELSVGVETITEYLSTKPPITQSYESYESLPDDNVFAEHFDRPITSLITEQWFENPALGGKGKVDLIHSPTKLLDYKSGNSRTATRVVTQSNFDEIHDEPDFQALLYLAHHRQEHPGERLDFVFFYFLETMDDAITGEATIDDALTTITYHPVSFPAYAASRTAFDALCEGVVESNNRRKTLERLTYEKYSEFFARHAFPNIDDSDSLVDSSFTSRFIQHARSHVGEYKYVTKGAKSALRKLLGYRSQLYFKEDVDRFEDYLEETITQVNAYRSDKFPVGEPNEERLNHPDLIRSND